MGPVLNYVTVPRSVHPPGATSRLSLSLRSGVSAPWLALSVQQDEGLQFLGDVSPILEAVLDDGPGGEALQGGVVYGLDDVPGQLLLVQEVAGSLLEGIGAVEMSPG